MKIPFNSLLDTLILERFLVRIGKSKYVDKLIFKGGMCLAQFIELNRETRDIDFLLTELKGSIEGIENIIKEIAALDIGDDFIFTLMQVSELSIEHKKYPGYRIYLQGELGQIKNRISIDIGVGDIVRPKFLEVELMRSKEPLFEDNINLQAYPPEYIFSEKLEAILHHGDLGSRMKDFYDCYRMIQENILDEVLLRDALVETTANRGTKLTLVSEELDVFSGLWQNFLKGNQLDNINMKDVVDTINFLLKKLIPKG
jgi:predicted nucleotidyltransferase component of viral defense system